MGKLDVICWLDEVIAPSALELVIPLMMLKQFEHLANSKEDLKRLKNSLINAG
ncbi:hypothetical protein ACOCEA_09465 [Maribacter sp. CXY002]|uniref:hypothetical protein n=1 Tax=Maribacter luteocoastalis TaxID=3407671 RepID=UPI003B66E774